ncbi:MAG: hypothetical protein QXE05_12065 [Nitrososphaeria archaeon]
MDKQIGSTRSYSSNELKNVSKFEWSISTTVSLRRRIHLHITEQNGIVERVNKIIKESITPLIITDYENAQND